MTPDYDAVCGWLPDGLRTNAKISCKNVSACPRSDLEYTLSARTHKYGQNYIDNECNMRQPARPPTAPGQSRSR
jgi:hypothetical protein